MATNRRKFLELLALGVPATTTVIRQDLPAAIQPRRDSKDETEEYVIPLDLVSGVREHLWEGGASIHVIRHARSEWPGKIRRVIGVEEPRANGRKNKSASSASPALWSAVMTERMGKSFIYELLFLEKEYSSRSTAASGESGEVAGN